MRGTEYIEEFLSDYEDNEQENNISEIQEENKYDTYFEGTEKISDKAIFIENIILDKKIIGRKYYGINKEIKYIEIFENNIFNLLRISPNVTFLYLYDKKEKKGYKENKFIGFRYYDKGPNQSDSKYFTLINRFNTKFHILEKDKSIKDINNNNFFDKELNCFSIIDNIIIQKYKNKNHIMRGETFPEIIGYCYSLISLNKIKIFIFLEPLIPEPLKPYTLKENISEFDAKITYIEPLIYNGHISLIIFNERNSKRCNLILDMSKYHINTSHLNTLIFPKNVNDKNCVYSCTPIQNYSSCCLWFYGEIDCILNNNKYTNMASIYKNMNNNNINFYIDVINLIGIKYYEINEILKYEKSRSKDTKIMDLNRFFVAGKNNISVHKDILFTQFLNINNFFKGFWFFTSVYDIKFIMNAEKKLETFINYQNLLDFNYRYYRMIGQEKDLKEIMDLIKSEIEFIDRSLIEIKQKYTIEFYRKNIASYELYFVEDILKDKPIVFPLSNEMQRKMEELDFNSFMIDIGAMFDEKKLELERNYCIYSEEDILKQLNPLNEICFKIMNK